MRAENEYLKKLWALQRKKNVSKIAQYAVVDQLSFKGYSILMLCGNRSCIQKWVLQMAANVVRLLVKQLEDQFLKEKIVEDINAYGSILGYPRMRIWLKKTYGIHVNHKRVYRLMKQMGIQAQDSQEKVI
ncbi:IS3 family transposase [Paenibacillus larvae]|uniref:IS3 family transposase n=1 Tax=Paenibacillus larvae TaxID=1464 RepID=UPI0028906045|nr:IS3 family transposase [Paenibacillus larvae]MDT2191950.1 IS3 family transposase [Paenibacillus larvae]